MTVLLVIDTFGIDSEQAIVADNNFSAIDKLRQTITQHLKNHDENLLRIRFKSQALYERFRDFEGLDNVLPTQRLLPRFVYRDRVDEVLPDWLSNELIIQLNLLNSQEIQASSSKLLDNIIRTCGRDLLAKDFIVFTKALKEQNNSFWRLLAVPEVKERFYEHFRFAFDFSEELTTVFLHKILEKQSIEAFLTLLAYDQHQDLLRKKIAQLQLHVSLPPKSLPSILLSVPPLELHEQEAKELPSKCINALEELARNIEKEKAGPSDVATLIIAPWPTLLNKLVELAERNGRLVSTELIEKLDFFHSKQANQLAETFQKQINLTQLSKLSDDATTDEVLLWSEGYFELVRQQFLHKQAVNETLNLSFSKWLVKQSARVTRSGADWRQFSKRIESFLQQDYLVVVCVVDALSALNQDLLLECAKQIEHLDLKSEMLFAPLPTLTEVGKMAIVTGKPTSQLPSDQETAIRHSYQAYLPEKNSLKVIKSWKSASEHIEEKTNLVVFFENRIDERLHECVDFSKHRKDVSPILKQVMASIDNWKKDAFYINREVAFLITADHGMTVVQTKYQGEALGEGKERVFKTKNTPNDHVDGFVFIQQDTNSGYLVPTARVGLNDSADLTHGGLTPEEVLVPFVTLTSSQPEAIKTPLELMVLNNKCQRLSDKTWRLSVELFASVAVKNVEIKLESPLNGEESIMALDASSRQRLFLDFSSSSEQIGLTDITIYLKYERDGAHEINTKLLPCVFPEPLIEKDEATQGFEDMFN